MSSSYTHSLSALPALSLQYSNGIGTRPTTVKRYRYYVCVRVWLVCGFWFGLSARVHLTSLLTSQRRLVRSFGPFHHDPSICLQHFHSATVLSWKSSVPNQPSPGIIPHVTQPRTTKPRPGLDSPTRPLRCLDQLPSSQHAGRRLLHNQCH